MTGPWLLPPRLSRIRCLPTARPAPPALPLPPLPDKGGAPLPSKLYLPIRHPDTHGCDALPAQHASRALVTLITRPAERHHHDTTAVPLESPSPRIANHGTRRPQALAGWLAG